MMPRKLIVLLGLAALTAPADTISFERHIRPIFQTHCFHCHGEDGAKKGGLDVRLKRLLVQGGKSGAAIVAKEPAQSLLLQKIRSGEMPKGQAKLPAHEIDLRCRGLLVLFDRYRYLLGSQGPLYPWAERLGRRINTDVFNTRRVRWDSG